MEIVKWLVDKSSAVVAEAVVKVDPGELADVEKMVDLLDGLGPGNFGWSVFILGVDKEPSYSEPPGGKVYPSQQFGFPAAGEVKDKTRYYRVRVNRD